MTTRSNRERELARAHYERQQARRAQRARRVRRRQQVGLAVVGVVLLALVLALVLT